MIKQLNYIDHNGEIVRTDTIQFKGRFQEDKGYTLYAYGKTIHGRDFPFPPDVTPLEIGYLALLSRHLLVDSNIIGKKVKTKQGWRAYSIEEIGKVLGIVSIYRYIQRMIDTKMVAKIGRGKTAYYVMNPLYFLKGKTIDDELYWLFEDSMKEHLTKWVHDTYKKRKEEGAV